MRLGFTKSYIAIAAVVIMVAGGISVQADLSDPTISVYYGFEGDDDVVKDGSVNGNDGMIVGNVVRDEGVYGKSIVLETDSWIDMNGPEFTNGPVEGFTIAVWVNHTGSSSPQTLLDAIGTDHGNGLFHMEIRSGGFRFFHRDGNNAEVFNINPGPVIEANTWVHFAGTYDSESNEVKTYIDGEETHSVSGSGNPCSDNWGVTAGIGHHKNGRWFNGMLDEYFIFNRAVSASEITDIMNGVLTSVEPADKLTTTWGNIKSHR